MVAHRLVRQLREAGHLLYLPPEQGVSGQPDADHLAKATSLGAVLVSQNHQDFAPLHYQCQAEHRPHAGIILVAGRTSLATKFACLERAGRLLTPEMARNHLMHLGQFGTDERAEAFVISLTPLRPQP